MYESILKGSPCRTRERRLRADPPSEKLQSDYFRTSEAPSTSPAEADAAHTVRTRLTGTLSRLGTRPFALLLPGVLARWPHEPWPRCPPGPRDCVWPGNSWQAADGAGLPKRRFCTLLGERRGETLCPLAHSDACLSIASRMLSAPRLRLDGVATIYAPRRHGY